MSTVSDIVNAACRQLGFTPTANEAADGLRALNLLLVSLASSPQGLYQTARESFTLTSGTASYTIGPSGAFNTTQPVRIVSAFVRNGDIDYPLSTHKLTAEEYASIAQKSMGGMPEHYFFERGATTGTIILYPTPDSAYALHIYSHKPLAQYTSLSDTITLPPEYEPMLKFQLAVDLAAEFGIQIPPQVAVRADNLLAELKRMNTNVPRAACLPFSSPGSFQIERGY